MNHSDSVFESVYNGGVLPSLDTLYFPDATAFIQSLDVINNSPLSVWLTVQGSVIVIAPYRREVLSVPPSKSVTVSYNGQATANGFVYIYFSDQTQQPASYGLSDSKNDGVIACVSKIISVPGSATGWADPNLFTAEVQKYASAILQQGAVGTVNTFSKRISVVHLSVSNMPIGANTYWQLVPNGASNQYNIYSNSQGGAEVDFAYPYPMYDVAPADTIGETVKIGFWVENTPAGGPFNVPVTLQCLLT